MGSESESLPSPTTMGNLLNNMGPTTIILEYKEDSEIVINTFLGLEIVSVVSCIMCNSLVLLLMFKTRKKQDSRKLRYIISLLVANLLAGMLALPFAITTHFVHDDISAFCQSFQYLIHLFEFAEVYSLVAIAVDRYHVIISHRLDGSSKSKMSPSVGVAIIWTAAILFSIPAPFLYEQHIIILLDGETKFEYTECAFIDNSLIRQIFVVADACVLFVIPLVVICSSYAHLVLYIKKESRTSSIKSQWKVLRIVITLIAIFVIFNLPLLIFDIYVAFSKSDFPHKDAVQLFVEFIAFLNFTVNSFVYVKMSSNLKSAFKEVMCCKGVSNARVEPDVTPHSRKTTQHNSGNHTPCTPQTAQTTQMCSAVRQSQRY